MFKIIGELFFKKQMCTEKNDNFENSKFRNLLGNRQNRLPMYTISSTKLNSF